MIRLVSRFWVLLVKFQNLVYTAKANCLSLLLKIEIPTRPSLEQLQLFEKTPTGTPPSSL